MIGQDLDRKRLQHIRREFAAALATAEDRLRDRRLKAIKRQADQMGGALYRHGLVLGTASLIANPPDGEEDKRAQSCCLTAIRKWLMMQEPAKLVLDGVTLDPPLPPNSPEINVLTEKLMRMEEGDPKAYWFVEAEALRYLELLKLHAKMTAALQDEREGG